MNTIPGGAYQSADGSWHDANGKTLTKEQIAAAQALIAERQQELDELEFRRAERDPDALKAIAAMLRPPVAAPVGRGRAAKQEE
jgi:hypothetical protein